MAEPLVPESSRWRALAANAAIGATVTAVALLLVEGCASVVLRTYEVLFVEKGVIERRHTRYDELLGWINLPNLEVQDIYDPGTVLHTNSRGFRGTEEYAVEVPAGRTRVVCSGDSYTFGVDVSDDETWCHQLEVLEPRLETMNMGLGGYGIDQAFLWYQRDGQQYAHDIHIFAFITADFGRMATSSLLGYGKPLLAIRDGALAVENTPVPRTGYIRIVMNIRHTLEGLRTIELLQALLKRVPDVGEAKPARSSEEVRILAARVFDELAAINRAKGSVLLLVYLPNIFDYQIPGHADELRSFAREFAREHSIPFLDLVGPFLQLPLEEAQRMFVRLQGAHYSAQGNRWVAERILETVRGIPQGDLSE